MVESHAPDGVRTPAQYLKGVGEKRAQILAKLGLHTARDLLFFFPRDYQDLTRLTPVDDFEEGVLVRTVGVVESTVSSGFGNRSRFSAIIRQDRYQLGCVWFNQPYVAKQLREGEEIVVTGTPKFRGSRWEMHHPQIERLIAGSTSLGGLQPIYRLTEGISQFQMRSVIQNTVEAHADGVVDVFTDALRKGYGLLPISQAIRVMHAPQDEAALREARYRFAYQELFTMQLGLALRHATVTHAASPRLPCDAVIDARITRLLPYTLTAGQREVVGEIVRDLERPRAMNRMLQGDVGSGKTLVAAYAMLVAIANEHQAAMMAPTEILARQHFDSLRRILVESRVELGLVTGATTLSERRKLRERIARGEVDLVIGTQALVQDDIEFAKLGLAVVDEGHKFGVRQRAKLRQGDCEPHYLVMTATPIPRTVSMTLFGDLDMSTLREMPKGRQPVHTYVGEEGKRGAWWGFVRKKLREGRQAYVIAPLVDENEDRDVCSVENLFERLCSEELDEFRVNLLHGKMTSDEKHDAMARFRDGDTQVLVATSLVEVGVDVPNATVMTIENAERFGLAQLHQLRGRICRGPYPGFLCVYSPSATSVAQQRLADFASTQDGFALAELDFQSRGPGDLFGTKQHGLPKLRIADLQHDREILEVARREARALVESDPQLSNPELSELRRRVLLRYGTTLQLGDVG